MGMSSVYRLMKLNRAIRSHRPKFAGVYLLSKLRARHLFLRFDPVVACNLNCQMCMFSNSDYRKKNKGIFTEAEIDRLAAMFFPRTVQVVFGCGAEPTLYRNYPDLVKIAKYHGVPNVGMVTNAQRFTEDSVRALVRNGLDELIISVHGITKESYERFMAGASYEKLHEVLATIDRVKREVGSARPDVRINYTVNSDNLEELGSFFDVFGAYDIRTLQVRPIMDCGQIAYRKFDLDRYVELYRETIGRLHSDCRARGIALLARREDPGYTGSTTPKAAGSGVPANTNAGAAGGKRAGTDGETAARPDAERLARKAKRRAARQRRRARALEAAGSRAPEAAREAARVPVLRAAAAAGAAVSTRTPGSAPAAPAGDEGPARADGEKARAGKGRARKGQARKGGAQGKAVPGKAGKGKAAQGKAARGQGVPAAPKPRAAPEDYGSLALGSVRRFVSPQRVWRTDFDWRNEDYDTFCKRIGFHRALLEAVFMDAGEVARRNQALGPLTLSYEVL